MEYISTTIKYYTACIDLLAVAQSVFHKAGDEILMQGTVTQIEIRNIVRGRDLENVAVRNPAGENLGTIKDVMIDISEGCIAYAALSFGGILGFGDKLFAIPWEAFAYTAADTHFILDVPKERLENAPGFDKSSWPTTTEREWLTGMYSHYGYTPYWERRFER